MRTPCALLFCFAFSTVVQAQTIDVGELQLLPNQPDQLIELFVTGGALVETVNLNVQIGNGVMGGPMFQMLDAVNGTIFDGVNDGQFNISTDPQLFSTTVTTPFTSPATTVPASGNLATLTIDTTGIYSGSFEFLLSGTLAGNTDFGPDVNGNHIAANITNGTSVVIPEPTAMALLLPAGWLFVRHRRRQ